MMKEKGSEIAEEIIAERIREKMFKRFLKKKKENEERLKNKEKICKNQK